MVIIIVKKLWGNKESNNSFSKFSVAVAIKAWYYLFETRRVANRIQIKFFITSVYMGRVVFTKSGRHAMRIWKEIHVRMAKE